MMFKVVGVNCDTSARSRPVGSSGMSVAEKKAHQQGMDVHHCQHVTSEAIDAEIQPERELHRGEIAVSRGKTKWALLIVLVLGAVTLIMCWSRVRAMLHR